MSKKLIIVESPGKIKTIEKFLDATYEVVSSNGHIRDLPSSSFGIDIENDFSPSYVVHESKEKQVALLKSKTQKATFVYLASDSDREGEAIAWHIKEVLNIPNEKYERIVFQAITKTAIQQALARPRKLDDHLVAAQQGRRLLDRIVGYKLSPILWKKIRNNLSAGRVQSVAVRLIVERERAVHAFKPEAKYKVKSLFALPDDKKLKADLDTKFDTYNQAKAFLTDCKLSTFTVSDIKQTKTRQSPPPPFMTSTLQQAAAQILGFSIDSTMRCAQKLYESGKITYMRTDSLKLDPEALSDAKKFIVKTYGKEFHTKRAYQTHAAGAQEAHEAIRPTRFSEKIASEDPREQKLYQLIRTRALASQMSDALLDKTTVEISISTREEKFLAKGEVILFKGFLTLYQAEGADETILFLPPLQRGQKMSPDQIQARETFTKAPPRYTEASLVKKLEVLGIGRPSTYRPIISTIQQRGYVEKRSQEGEKRSYALLVLQGDTIEETRSEELVGSEKNKFFPTSIGVLVNDFLLLHFQDIMDYDFTANTESRLDEIAQGKLFWKKMLAAFYEPFAKRIEKVSNSAKDSDKKELGLVRPLGQDPKSGKPVFARLSRRYGPMVQLGALDQEEKPRFASLRKGQILDLITLEEALKLFDLPREVGIWEGEPIIACIGRFGPYLKYQDISCSLGNLDPYNIQEDEAIQLILAKRKLKEPIKIFAEDKTIVIRNGRFGPYIQCPEKNVRIPKDYDPDTLTLAMCKDLIARSLEKKKPSPTRKKR